MVKKMLALLLLFSFQAKPEQGFNQNEPEVECLTQKEQCTVFRSRKKCKCFCCIKAATATFGTLTVTGNQSILGSLTIGGTLTIGGVPLNELLGLPGTPGATGAIGETGATGATGLGLTTYGYFYALMPPDNTATVAPGTAVQFPQDGPTSGISRSTASDFVLPAIGTYEITWQVSVDEAGQLDLWLDSGSGAVEQPQTVVGRATGTSQIVGNVFITTTAANSVISIRNPSGNATALTITPIAGGTHPVSASLTIKRLS